jgi:sucrose-phosphate synthase
VSAAGLRLLLVSIHGLVRGESPELGRDPDTGGQVLYVLELARALGRHPGVAQVDLLTRRIEDPAVGPEYACPEEALGPCARILRVPCGPRRHLRKELLWDHLDEMVDGYLALARRQAQLPDLIHGHYADAGYVAMRLSGLLGIPFVQTAHSLGRCKRERLLQAGGREAVLERQFHFSRRIQAEEDAAALTSAFIASTRQEIREQYGSYRNFDPERGHVLPPGTDLARFGPPMAGAGRPRVAAQVDRFLRQPRKPMLLCIGRPTPRKNLVGLVEAFGRDPALREMANLVLLAGNRDDLRDLDEVSRATWEEILRTIDRHDLYGQVAIPKTHTQADIPEYYRLAALRRGLCVNPSLNETFGLTLIEAAASGLPVVATDSGGPKDIVANCRNGMLLDAMDPAAMAAALRDALADRERWTAWSRNGIRGVRSTYTWDAHVDRYLKLVTRILRRSRKQVRRSLMARQVGDRPPLLAAEGALVLDLDRTLIGDRASLAALLPGIRGLRPRMAFGIVTGRRLESALWTLQDWGVGDLDFLVTSVGTEIRYGPELVLDAAWDQHIRWRWRRDEVARALAEVPGLRPQAQGKCGPFKVSYHVSPTRFPGVAAVQDLLQGQGLSARLVYSQSRFLDVLPHRASKGQAVRRIARKWGLPLDRVIAAGDSGSDLDLLTGDLLGIVVANHSAELEPLRDRERVYFADLPFAAGVAEGLVHYGVLQPGGILEEACV